MTIALWISFVAFILVMLALDLGLLNRKEHVVGAREALGWTTVCVVLALLFNIFIYFLYEYQWFGMLRPPGGGTQAATEFFAGWLIEYSLSLDNIFVIAVIFEYLRVPTLYQHRVLFWGILGALIMRGGMILISAALVKFEVVIIIFGLLLIWSAVKMLRSDEEEPHPDRNPLVRIARRFYPVTPDYVGHHFFAEFNGRRAITPLFVALLVVEGTDVLFAVDSIPAVFAVTQDPFIVFSSNVFAILGLRSLYFALATLLRQFKYLKVSLAFVLAYVGVKMLLDAADVYHIEVQVTLGVIAGILAVGIIASITAARAVISAALSALSPNMRTAIPSAEREKMVYQTARRVAVFIVGMSVVIFGLILAIPLVPGPGFIVIPLGLAILATEFVWARRLLKKLKDGAQQLANRVRGRKSTPNTTSQKPADPIN